MNRFLRLIGPSLLAILTSYLASQLPSVNANSVQLVAIGAVVLVCSYTAFHFFPIGKAYIQLYSVGKFRGLWSNGDLNNSIEQEYKNSNQLKVKVTRGYGLFYKESGIFSKCFYINKYKEPKFVKVLLHYPCLKSQHLRRRAEANQISLTQYIDDLFRVMRKFKDHTLDKNSVEEISIRFYSTDQEDDFRYYIFRNFIQSKTLFFNHYDDKITGAKSKMLRVKSGQDSLCDEMERQFDKLFDRFSIELVENKKDDYKLINDDFCGHPACRTKIIQSYNRFFVQT